MGDKVTIVDENEAGEDKVVIAPKNATVIIPEEKQVEVERTTVTRTTTVEKSGH